jgi:cobalt/nickel transport system permease protein
MASKIPSVLLESTSPALSRRTGKVKVHFLERGIDYLGGLIKSGYAQWELSSQNGVFQKVDSRVKVLFFLFLIVVVSVKRDLLPEIGIWSFLFVLTLFSRLSIREVYRRVLFLGFVFGFLIALPSAFNVITKGEIIIPIARLSRSYNFWIYRIPAEIGITREGAYGVALLTMRVINSLSLSSLLVYTTPFHEIVRALKVLKVPDSFLIIMTLCYRYIFIFSKTVEDMHLAKKSRMVRELSNSEAREWVAGRMAFGFRKTRLRCEEVFEAMIGRGFSDTIRIYGFRKMRVVDWCAAIFLFFASIVFLLL